MTIDLVGNLKNYKHLHSSLEAFCDFLSDNNLNDVNEKVTAERFNIIPISCESNIDLDHTILEAHRTQFDIHIVLEGEDIIAFKDLNSGVELYKEYDEDNDYLLVKASDLNEIKLKSGYFCFIPNNFAHMALYGIKSKCKKIVVKLK